MSLDVEDVECRKKAGAVVLGGFGVWDAGPTCGGGEPLGQEGAYLMAWGTQAGGQLKSSAMKVHTGGEGT